MKNGVLKKDLIKKSKRIALIAAEPFELFKAVFPNYYVTSFDGIKLCNFSEERNIFYGLEISPMLPVYGLTGSIDGLLNGESNIIVKAKRPQSETQIQRIIQIKELIERLSMSSDFESGIRNDSRNFSKKQIQIYLANLLIND